MTRLDGGYTILPRTLGPLHTPGPVTSLHLRHTSQAVLMLPMTPSPCRCCLATTVTMATVCRPAHVSWSVSRCCILNDCYFYADGFLSH